MIKLRFFNSLGEVRFDENGWHLTEADGLSIPSKMLTAARYTNQPGQTTTSCVANPRTITLSGDINIEKNGADALSLGCVILDSEGVLEVRTERFTRQIKARCTELVFGERNGPYRVFVAQFLCDCPYFEDKDYTEDVIYGRIPMLSKETVLPSVFSKRTSKGDMYYPGSAFAEPIIHVSVPDGTGTITIHNATTGGKIGFRYDGSLFSSLTIDVENRTIKDDAGNMRFELLTDDSFFDGFNLVTGANSLEVLNSNVGANVIARMQYKVRYTEAVV